MWKIFYTIIIIISSSLIINRHEPSRHRMTRDEVLQCILFSSTLLCSVEEIYVLLQWSLISSRDKPIPHYLRKLSYCILLPSCTTWKDLLSYYSFVAAVEVVNVIKVVGRLPHYLRWVSWCTLSPTTIKMRKRYLTLLLSLEQSQDKPILHYLRKMSRCLSLPLSLFSTVRENFVLLIYLLLKHISLILYLSLTCQNTHSPHL